jgi:hypothetical protein
MLYSSKSMNLLGNRVTSFWIKGYAEYLTSDFGDECDESVAHADADHAHDLRTRWSVSSYFLFLNQVLVSWGCKKKTETALHSCGSEVTSLHCCSQKTKLLYQFLASIDCPLVGPSF